MGRRNGSRDDESGESHSESEYKSTDSHDPVSSRAKCDGLHDYERRGSFSGRHSHAFMKRSSPAPIMKITSARPMTNLRPQRSACKKNGENMSVTSAS